MITCFVCGTDFEAKLASNPIDDHLSRTWELRKGQRKLFNAREGLCCPHCYSNQRAEGLAKTINKYFRVKGSSFKDFVTFANKHSLSIAEINSCHGLHSQLKNIKKLQYSEYNPADSKTKTRSEDITALSHKSNSFDLVLHSETLEHVPDPEAAIEECRRVLKRRGVCLFTIPVILNRHTRQRVMYNNGQRKSIMEKSYHGFGREDCLVWWEFGGDFIINNRLSIVGAFPRYQNYVLAIRKSTAERKARIWQHKLTERANMLWATV